MIYIVESSKQYECSVIESVWDVDCADVKKEYNKVMLESAKKLELDVNYHWLNVMNHTNHNLHLSAAEYESKSKQWNRHLEEFTVEVFIREILKGVQVDFKTL